VTTRTDAQGEFLFSNLAWGEYRIGVHDSTGVYATTFYTDAVTSFLATPVIAPERRIVPGIYVYPKLGGTITGRVTQAGGAAVPDYQLAVYQWLGDAWALLAHVDVRTDAEGKYTIQGLPAGTYRIGALAPDEVLPRENWLCAEPVRAAERCHEDREYNNTPFFYPMGKGIRTASDVQVTAGATTTGIDLVVNPLTVRLPLLNTGEITHPRGTVWQTLVDAGEFDTLLQLFAAANMTFTLDGGSISTLFAPTDAAFAALPAGAVDQLLRNPAQLGSILHYHMTLTPLWTNDLRPGIQIRSWLDRLLSFDVEGDQFRVNGAGIVTADIPATNGVIHVIDAVLLPPPD
jgi:uncharacterized surface protein with fasciclin (FAS1) repeats